MPATPQSDTLVAEEASKVPDMFERAHKSIAEREAVEKDTEFMQNDGSYCIQKIKCLGDSVALAPLLEPRFSDGGIVIPDGAQSIPDTAIVIGMGPKADEITGCQSLVGHRVSYSHKFKLADLSGKIPYYGSMAVILTKANNIFADLGEVPHKVCDENQIQS